MPAMHTSRVHLQRSLIHGNQCQECVPRFRCNTVLRSEATHRSLQSHDLRPYAVQPQFPYRVLIPLPRNSSSNSELLMSLLRTAGQITNFFVSMTCDNLLCQVLCLKIQVPLGVQENINRCRIQRGHLKDPQRAATKTTQACTHRHTRCV